MFDGQYAKEIANLTVLIPEERLQKYRSKFQAELRSVASVAQEGFTGISETLGAETAKAMSTWGSIGLRHVASITASSLELIKSDTVEGIDWQRFTHVHRGELQCGSKQSRAQQGGHAGIHSFADAAEARLGIQINGAALRVCTAVSLRKACRIAADPT